MSEVEEERITNLDPYDVLEELVAEAFGVEEGCAPGRKAALALLAIRALWAVAKSADTVVEHASYNYPRGTPQYDEFLKLLAALDNLEKVQAMPMKSGAEGEKR